jgi:hypothetical protein
MPERPAEAKEEMRLRVSEALHRLIHSDDWRAVEFKLEEKLAELKTVILDIDTEDQQYREKRAMYWALKGFFGFLASEAKYQESKTREKAIRAENPDVIIRGMRP